MAPTLVARHWRAGGAPPLGAASSWLRSGTVRSASSWLRSTTAHAAAAGAARESPEQFWLRAAERIDWFRKPTIGLDESRAPVYQWFPDGLLNTCHNALDRHLATRQAQTALAYHSSVGGLSRNITYGELHRDVSQFAGALAELGVVRGDRVLIYMPMVPEAVVAMLACARIGAVHSVVFGGFAPKELAIRVADAEPKVMVTSSCGIEKGRVLPYAPMLEAALSLTTHAPAHVVVHQRLEAPEALVDLGVRSTAAVVADGGGGGGGGGSPRWHDFYRVLQGASAHECVPVSASDALYLLYTSGSTGKPKGVVRDNTHCVALQWTMDEFMGVAPGETYWAASDIGWVVGHSYICYAPLLHGTPRLGLNRMGV